MLSGRRLFSRRKVSVLHAHREAAVDSIPGSLRSAFPGAWRSSVANRGCGGRERLDADRTGRREPLCARRRAFGARHGLCGRNHLRRRVDPLSQRGQRRDLGIDRHPGATKHLLLLGRFGRPEPALPRGLRQPAAQPRRRRHLGPERRRTPVPLPRVAGRGRSTRPQLSADRQRRRRLPQPRPGGLLAADLAGGRAADRRRSIRSHSPRLRRQDLCVDLWRRNVRQCRLRRHLGLGEPGPAADVRAEGPGIRSAERGVALRSGRLRRLPQPRWRQVLDFGSGRFRRPGSGAASRRDRELRGVRSPARPERPTDAALKRCWRNLAGTGESALERPQLRVLGPRGDAGSAARDEHSGRRPQHRRRDDLADCELGDVRHRGLEPDAGPPGPAEDLRRRLLSPRQQRNPALLGPRRDVAGSGGVDGRRQTLPARLADRSGQSGPSPRGGLGGAGFRSLGASRPARTPARRGALSRVRSTACISSSSSSTRWSPVVYSGWARRSCRPAVSSAPPTFRKTRGRAGSASTPSRRPID